VDRTRISKVLVTGRDSGPGLDPQNVERAFEAFYTTKPQGLGMGSAISRSSPNRRARDLIGIVWPAFPSEKASEL
jgi:C4-dicarboxylate-specific signal transduction histidine kinase